MLFDHGPDAGTLHNLGAKAQDIHSLLLLNFAISVRNRKIA